MSLFDAIFRKNAKVDPVCEPLTVYSPLAGKVIPLSEFPDRVFADGVLGHGCGIVPSGTKIYAPCDGVVSSSPKTGHAVGITTPDGMDVLIHIGVDTVEMHGKGFRIYTEKGQTVKKGMLLISFDREEIKAAGHPDTVAVVVMNSDDFGSPDVTSSSDVQVGDRLFSFKKEN